MPQYDTIIRNGTLIDGSGAAAFTGDLAISDGQIAAIGKVEGSAAQEVDASGLAVMLGRLCHPLDGTRHHHCCDR